jgi:hypothetical protein
MSPKAYRQNRNPENVSYIEGPDGNGSAGRLAGKTVVIAKRNPFGPKMESAANDEHGIRQRLFAVY